MNSIYLQILTELTILGVQVILNRWISSMKTRLNQNLLFFCVLKWIMWPNWMKNALCIRKSIVSSPNEYIKSCEECEKQKLTEELGQKLFAAYLLQMENCNHASEYNAQQLRLLLTWF